MTTVNQDHKARTHHTYSAAQTGAEAGRLVRTALDRGLGSTDGQAALTSARVLMDLAIMQAKIEQSHAVIHMVDQTAATPAA